ncbi:hypothetical protein ABK040_002118 [Willaertia magna]
MAFLLHNRNKQSGSDEDAFESMYQLHTASSTICAAPYRILQTQSAPRGGSEDEQIAAKLFSTGYFHSCLDNAFKKYDLYKSSKAKTLWQEKECYPDITEVNEIVIKQTLRAGNKNKKDNNPEEEKDENQKLGQFLQEFSICYQQKRITRGVLEDKLKHAMNSKFYETGPKEWINKLDEISKLDKDLVYYPKTKKELLETTDSQLNPCLKFSGSADLSPRVELSTIMQSVPKSEFDEMIRTMKFSHCQISLLCAKSLKNCMSKFNNGKISNVNNQQFVQCFQDPSVIQCINKIQ